MASVWRSMTCGGDLAESEVSRLLQASMPSAHVWSNFLSPTSPHFLNQAPSRAQQLCLLDFLMVPHLAHLVLLLALVIIVDKLVIVASSVNKCTRWHQIKGTKVMVAYTVRIQCTSKSARESISISTTVMTLHLLCPWPTFADLDAISPCIIKSCVGGISAFPEPSTATSATAKCARFTGSTALGTPGIAAVPRERSYRRGYFCRYMRGLTKYERDLAPISPPKELYVALFEWTGKRTGNLERCSRFTCNSSSDKWICRTSRTHRGGCFSRYCEYTVGIPCVQFETRAASITRYPHD